MLLIAVPSIIRDPIDVRLSGSIRLSSALQPLNVQFPMLATFSDRLTFARLVQSINTLSPMLAVYSTVLL